MGYSEITGLFWLSIIIMAPNIILEGTHMPMLRTPKYLHSLELRRYPSGSNKFFGTLDTRGPVLGFHH